MNKNNKIELTILIPVYNEIKTIKTILQKVKNIAKNEYEIIIVDDCSKDGSADVIKNFIKLNNNLNTALFTHAKNLGKGAAIKTGLKNARGKYFIIQDADLEYDPNDIPKLLTYAHKNKAKAVYGSRFLGNIHGMLFMNYLANKFYNYLVSFLYLVKITDMHTCYKLVDTELLRSFNLKANGFDYAPELISKLLKSKFKVYEYPVTFHGRTKKQGKKINFRDGITCSYLLLRYRFETFKISFK